ncbi:hypothetical protein NBRC10512_004997 [Rhodotorula toruloides]|uniref:Uncharacterized protein n=1 Tax=Rhodotorula toruloides (strain NP11) TaxID=1130832 RepID=M7X286_RHOT1|nr:uncharacterized protein RHTO_04614 [Rhodotorula toruloides NP11]EMS24436.1 hypothetical protein RHTO_04614 [Rhodotorula toruloides NP11]
MRRLFAVHSPLSCIDSLIAHTGRADPPAAAPLTQRDLSPLLADQSPSTSSSDVLVQQLVTKCSSIPPEKLVEYLVNAGSAHVDKAAKATTEAETHLRSLLLLDRLAQSALPPPSLKRWKAFLSEQSTVPDDNLTQAALKEDWRDEAQKGENVYAELLGRVKAIVKDHTPWDNLEDVPWEGVRWSLTANFARSVLSLFAVICNLGPQDVVKEPRPPHHLIESRLAAVVKRAKGTSNGYGRKALVSALQELRPVYRAYPAQDPPAAADAGGAPPAAKPKKSRQKKPLPPPRQVDTLRNRTNVHGAFTGMTAPSKKLAARAVKVKKAAKEEEEAEADETDVDEDEEDEGGGPMEKGAPGGAGPGEGQARDEVGEGSSAHECEEHEEEPVIGGDGIEEQQQDKAAWSPPRFVTAAELSDLVKKRSNLVHELAQLCKTQEQLIADLEYVDSQIAHFTRGSVDRLLPTDPEDPLSLRQNALIVRYQVQEAKETDRRRRKADLRGEGIFSANRQDDFSSRTANQYIDSNTPNDDQDAAAAPPKRRRLDLAVPSDELDMIEAYNFAAHRDAFVDLDEQKEAVVRGTAGGSARSPDVSPVRHDGSPVYAPTNTSSRASTPAPPSSRAVDPLYPFSSPGRSVHRPSSPAPSACRSHSPGPAHNPSPLPDHLSRLAFFGADKPRLNNTVAEVLLDVFMVSDWMMGLHGMLEKEERSEASWRGADEEDEEMDDGWNAEDAGSAIDYWMNDWSSFSKEDVLRARNNRSWTDEAFAFAIGHLEQRLERVRESDTPDEVER